ncbi:MAG TPA: type I pantothenate kinase, partial [Myxococcota bacterium]|nr:type I pantothenate kinase [Myxococcota bacterium]
MESQPTPYLRLPRPLWAKLRDDAPMPLSGPEIARLRGQNEPVEPSEVEEIYLPLSRLLNLYIGASQDLYKVTTRFLGHPEPRVPYIIGVAGSVAVGKSTTSRVLKALLSRWESHPRVELVTTDGYLYPNAHLEQKGLMTRKGFPESYNQRALLQLLSDLKAGR